MPRAYSGVLSGLKRCKHEIGYPSRMIDWLNPLKELLNRRPTAVVVTVIAVDGSVPREIGATMIVSDDQETGTIGGGNLEYSAIARARELLTEPHSIEPHSIECQRVALGPSLGQCCGGRVELLYERVSLKSCWLQALAMQPVDQVSDDRWLFRCLDSLESFVALPTDDVARSIELRSCAGISQAGDDGKRWFCQPVRPDLPDIWIFGAGHVGQSVVEQLSLLPCRISWFDHRQEWLSHRPELDVRRVLTDAPADEVAAAAANAYFVVMTHSHAVDFDICYAVLQREQFAWLGLIGSITKRQTFTNRLRQRGIPEGLIEQMACPLGNLPLRSSLPSIIALNLAAELAPLWHSNVE